MLEEKQRLEKQMKSIDLELSRLPSVHIFCTKNGNHYKWYESDGKKNKYIPKKKRSYAESLARKKYLTLLRQELLEEEKAIDLYLKYHRAAEGMADDLLVNNPAYAELLKPFFVPASQSLQEWMNSPYIRNEQYPEGLIYNVGLDVCVRSKSEAIIVMMLRANKIPFHYEEILKVGDNTYFPDFTVKHPRSGKIIHWEHFGMMDVPSYREKAIHKIQTYIDNGYIPGENFIMTFETEQNPLDPELVRKIIEYYFG